VPQASGCVQAVALGLPGGGVADEGVERVPVEGGLGRAVGVKPLLLVRAVAPPLVAVFRLLPPVVATGLPVSVPPLPPPAEDVPD